MNIPVTILWLLSSLIIVAIVSHVFQYYLTRVVISLHTMMNLMNNVSAYLVSMAELLEKINTQLGEVNNQLTKRNENR